MNYKAIISALIISVFLGLGFVFIFDKMQTKSFQSGVLSVEKTSNVANNKNKDPLLNDFTSLSSYIKNKPGIYGLYIKNLKAKEEYELNSEETFYGASLYKILLGGAVFDLINQDELSPNYLYIYTSQDYASGTGVLKNFAIGSSYSIDKLLDYLFKNSDNIAQNILERNITHKAVREFYEQSLNELDQNIPVGTFSENVNTSPKEISDILLSLYKTDKWSRSIKRDFFLRMTDTQFEDRVAVGLNDQLTFSHKIGNAPQYTSWHDCGVVFNKDFTDPTLVCLMSKNANYEDFLEVSATVGEFVSSFY